MARGLFEQSFPGAQGKAHLFGRVLFYSDNLVLPVDSLGFQLACQQVGVLQTQEISTKQSASLWEWLCWLRSPKGLRCTNQFQSDEIEHAGHSEHRCNVHTQSRSVSPIWFQNRVTGFLWSQGRPSQHNTKDEGSSTKSYPVSCQEIFLRGDQFFTAVAINPCKFYTPQENEASLPWEFEIPKAKLLTSSFPAQNPRQKGKNISGKASSSCN